MRGLLERRRGWGGVSVASRTLADVDFWELIDCCYLSAEFGDAGRC